jgi:hypothetical protein
MSAISSSALFTQAPASDWIADTITAIQQQAVQGGILGALSSRSDGSVRSFLGQGRSIANGFALIAQGSVSNSSAFYAQLAAQNDQKRSQDALQKTLAALSQSQNQVKPENVLDPVIYFKDGTTIDTSSNIMTRPDGTQYDTVTGALYVDPVSIIQMANGSYLNTKTNILTLTDGTRIDTVTGLKVSTTA